MGCCQFHIICRLGPWTPLISNPSSALSAVLKTGVCGGWLTAVVHWHMQYSLRRISRHRHDWASGPCMNALALRVTLYFCCVAHCLVLSSFVVTHVERLRARISNDTTHHFLYHYAFLSPIYCPSRIPHCPLQLTDHESYHWDTHACLDAPHRDVRACLDAPHRRLSCLGGGGTYPPARIPQGYQVCLIFFLFCQY